MIDLSISVLRRPEGLPDGHASAPATSIGIVPDTGYSPWGLRRAAPGGGPARHRLGPATDEHQVVITTGAQQGAQHRGRVLGAPGRHRASWRTRPTRARCPPSAPPAPGSSVCAVDRHGVRPDALRAALAEHPALVYLQPTLHSPTGVGARRQPPARRSPTCSPTPASRWWRTTRWPGSCGATRRRPSPSTGPTTRARWSARSASCSGAGCGSGSCGRPSRWRCGSPG